MPSHVNHRISWETTTVGDHGKSESEPQPNAVDCGELEVKRLHQMWGRRWDHCILLHSSTEKYIDEYYVK